jgi:hypothetical protein
VSVPFPGFVGPSYGLRNKYAAIERTINWYLVANESAGESKWKLSLSPCPGNAPFSALPVGAPFNQPCRGLLEVRGNVFGVNGTTVFYLQPGGGLINLGQITNDGSPVSMVANGNAQVFISNTGSAAGPAWVINSGVLVPIPITGTGFLGSSYATFQDGYIIVVTPGPQTEAGRPAGTQQFQISGTDAVPLGDATQWDAANISIQAGQADNLAAVISSREYLRLLGQRRSQIYYNVGAAGIGGFPFQSYNETFIETGLAAVFSLVDLGDSLFWIGQDARGQRAAWRDFAFQPQRVSNFAVEQFWANYATISDAIAFPLIWNGHTMVQITFPTANATWVWDVTLSQLLGRQIWFERNYTSAAGVQSARSEQFHCYAYGKHLVGSVGLDGNPGAIYQYSDAQYGDCGTAVGGAQAINQIVRDRISPHVWENKNRIIINRIRFELAVGVGLDGGPAIGGNPLLWFKWSKDAGNNWGPWQTIEVGQIGQFSQLVYFNRLGYARDWVFWVRCSDPVFWRIVNAELDLIECSS